MSPKRSLFGLLCALLALFPVAALPLLRVPEGLRPGDPLLVWAASPAPIEEGRLELHAPTGQFLVAVPLFLHERGEPAAGTPEAARAGPGPEAQPAAPAAPPPRFYGGLLALPLDLAAGSYGLRLSGLEGGAAFSLERLLEIEARDFPSEDIELDVSNTALRTAPDPAKEAEARALQALYALREPEARYFDAPLLLPVGAARRSAGFGDRRRFLYAGGGSEPGAHYGIDFAVPVGTPVLAPAGGRVVFVGDRIVTGLTLVLEHLPGLYSTYMHLSTSRAILGQIVERGEPVATSGNTGLSTGPHLHWELRAAGYAVDPDYWVGRAPLDTEWEKTAVFSPAFEGR